MLGTWLHVSRRNSYVYVDDTHGRHMTAEQATSKIDAVIDGVSESLTLREYHEFLVDFA